MDNQDHQTDQYKERRNSNTEYMPTKCRITKPAPPKPATNPLQFIKVAPCPLFQKAQEQIKKVEEIKREEKEMRTEIEEDWQTNLDNWKSSRRKRQEHIIERVVEVKKLTEQEENEKGRRKSKTFSEMMEERSKGRHKFNIPLYEDDSNDLSDYGIGSSSSKTNSIKDADTDDSNSLLDEKDNHIFDSSSNKENSSASNQSQSEDETNTTKNEHSNVNNNNAFNKTYTSTYSPRLNSNKSKPEPPTKPSVFENNYSSESKDTKQYTYEGAIQDYRSRIQTINSDDSSRYKNKEQTEVLLPKGEIFKRKGLFESNSVEISPLDSPSARRLSEDFVNTKSIKDRLRSFEQANDQTTKTVDKSDIQVSVKQRLQTFNKPNENDTKNNNLSKTNINKISNYLIDKSNNTNTFESKKSWNNDDRCFSPETELYVNKLNMFNRDLDNLMINKSLDENYAPSISSTELTCVSSDREDSGIHTGDVSCSVSQADESVDVEIASNINERLNEDTQFEKELAKFQADIEQFKPVDKHEDINENQKIEEIAEGTDQSHVPSTKEVIHVTEEFLEFSRKDASENLTYDKHLDEKEEEIPLPVTKPKPVIYENVDIKKFSPALDFITNDFIMDTPFPDFNPPPLEPPKVKPPPPPPPKEDEEVRNVQDPVKRANSTKRIKKEINSKRSSFLGLEEPTNEIDVPLEQPPDLSRFFPPKESKLEKIVGRKYPEGVLSKVESQDSGLDLDRGRLSSDTWCSSVNDSIAPSHERQASGQTNSITSEEDEITKKEREIIELVEKEEQYRDIVEYINKEPTTKTFNSEKDSAYEPSLGSEQFDSPCFNTPADFLDQDSEVLKVEQELRQLELEELERQRENLLFRESRAKAHLHSRHSLENLADKMYPCYLYENHVDCRKSMPELAIQNASFDYGRLVPNKHNYGYENIRDLELRGYVKPGPLIEGDLGIPINNRKSMPDLQHSHKKSSPEHHRSPIEPNVRIPLEQRKSMPELQQESSSAFKTPRPSIIPAKPLRAKEWGAYEQNAQLVPRQLTAVHRRDKWPHPKANGDGRNYNQHWLIQEAELRRISDQQKDLAAANNANRQQQRQRIPTRINNEKLQHPIQRPEQTYKEDYIQHSFRNHPPSVNHALPTVAYSPPVVPKESHDRILSVSGKKKCSYCGNELGRGAAMIVESLCLFYHMDCFKCCVCHVQLGDGRMGTDVKVRNQKLHCHNCYSSDDGVKFSCV